MNTSDQSHSGLLDFHERVCVVTGAAAGIGRATAELLASRGATLICLDRDKLGVDDVCAQVSASGVEALSIAGDVCEQATFDEIADVARKRFGRIDVLANIAGAWEMKGFDGMDAASWRCILDINLLSVLISLQTLTPLLRHSPSGRVVNVAATDGFRGSMAMPHYAAAKAGVINLTKSYALDLAPAGILVNCVAPGAIATPRAAQDTWLEERRKVVPLGRLGTAQDIASLVGYLASPANSFTTGITVPANGGMYMP